MITFPNAKINLGLHVKEKRRDGYHELETAFYPIGIYDALELVPGKETQMHISGLEVEGENLCMSAYRALKQDFNLTDVEIYLHKNIPMGAGLGGGSADAAFFLNMLNKEANLGLSKSDLHNYARRLGADCSFFIQNKPCLAYGIGDVLQALDLDLSAYQIQVVYPGIAIPTAEAYAGVDIGQAEIPLEEVLRHPVEDWKYLLKNDFEKSVFKRHPILKQTKSELYAQGALYASMSGSGSALYGLFNVEQVLPQWQEPDFRVFNANML